MMLLRRLWGGLPPALKRVAVIGGLVLALIVGANGVGHLFRGRKAASSAAQQPIRNVLTDRDPQALGIESVAARLKQVDQTTQDLQHQFRQLEQKLASAAGSSERLESWQQALEAVRKQLGELQSGQRSARASQPTESALAHEEASEPFGASQAAEASDGEGAPTSEGPIQIFHHVEAEPPPEKAAEPEAPKGLYLPAGSLLTGVLLTGLDAPTHQGARREPFPATLRIQKDAILPNRFRADVRECFLIISGYGDMSSERAYLRGEIFSCVREDGGVVESKLSAYAVGEDGKAGVRGRLVSKQGQIIAKSMMAGFLSGISKAFDVNPVPTLNLNPNGKTPYQPVFSPGMLQGAGAKGASTALDRVAKFYLDMAENLFPVIEVDAGRRIDIVLTQGAALQLAASGEH